MDKGKGVLNRYPFMDDSVQEPSPERRVWKGNEPGWSFVLVSSRVGNSQRRLIWQISDDDVPIRVDGGKRQRELSVKSCASSGVWEGFSSI